MKFGTEFFKLFRKNAPQTSFEAAEKVDTMSMERVVYERIFSYGEQGCISDQILADLPNVPYPTITARYRALLNKKYIEIIGTREGKSGKNQRVMRATQWK